MTGRFHNYIKTFDGSKDRFRGQAKYVLVESTTEVFESEKYQGFKIWLDLRKLDFRYPPLDSAAGEINVEFGTSEYT